MFCSDAVVTVLDTGSDQVFGIRRNYGPERLTRIIQNHGADKVLFASDSPWSNGQEEIAAIRSLPLEQEQIEMVLGKNAERLLRI